MAGIGQDWEPVVIRKKARTASAKKDEKAVNAAHRSGAEIETMKKHAGDAGDAGEEEGRLETTVGGGAVDDGWGDAEDAGGGWARERLDTRAVGSTTTTTCRGDVAELKESSITTLQEPDVLLGTSSTSPQAAAHDTMEVSPPSGCSSLGLPILVRKPPDWYYTFYIRIDLSGSFHTYPALDGPFPTLEEADNAIDRYLRHQLHPTMREESLNELPEIDSAVRRAMYWPDGARKKGWKCPVKNIPGNLLIQASLDQYNEDRSLVGGLAYELKDVLRHQFFFSKEGAYKHFNFTAKTKGADDFDSGILFFAEFKLMRGRKQIVAGCCCMVKPDDKGHCYGCANSGKADMQHPNEAGAYSCGHVNACCPVGGAFAPIDWIGREESVEAEEKRLKRMYEDFVDPRTEAMLYEIGRITANEEAHS